MLLNKHIEALGELVITLYGESRGTHTIRTAVFQDSVLKASKYSLLGFLVDRFQISVLFTNRSDQKETILIPLQNVLHRSVKKGPQMQGCHFVHYALQ